MNAPKICPQCGKNPVCVKSKANPGVCFQCGSARYDRARANMVKAAVQAWKKRSAK